MRLAAVRLAGPSTRSGPATRARLHLCVSIRGAFFLFAPAYAEHRVRRYTGAGATSAPVGRGAAPRGCSAPRAPTPAACMRVKRFISSSSCRRAAISAPVSDLLTPELLSSSRSEAAEAAGRGRSGRAVGAGASSASEPACEGEGVAGGCFHVHLVTGR